MFSVQGSGAQLARLFQFRCGKAIDRSECEAATLSVSVGFVKVCCAEQLRRLLLTNTAWAHLAPYSSEFGGHFAHTQHESTWRQISYFTQ